MQKYKKGYGNHLNALGYAPTSAGRDRRGRARVQGRGQGRRQAGAGQGPMRHGDGSERRRRGRRQGRRQDEGEGRVQGWGEGRGEGRRQAGRQGRGESKDEGKGSKTAAGATARGQGNCWLASQQPGSWPAGAAGAWLATRTQLAAEWLAWPYRHGWPPPHGKQSIRIHTCALWAPATGLGHHYTASRAGSRVHAPTCALGAGRGVGGQGLAEGLGHGLHLLGGRQRLQLHRLAAKLLPVLGLDARIPEQVFRGWGGQKRGVRVPWQATGGRKSIGQDVNGSWCRMCQACRVGWLCHSCAGRSMAGRSGAGILRASNPTGDSHI